jgi:hypothetical protein
MKKNKNAPAMACPTVLLKKVEASSTIDDSEEEERPKRIRACVPSQKKEPSDDQS